MVHISICIRAFTLGCIWWCKCVYASTCKLGREVALGRAHVYVYAPCLVGKVLGVQADMDLQNSSRMIFRPRDVGPLGTPGPWTHHYFNPEFNLQYFLVYYWFHSCSCSFVALLKWYMLVTLLFR